MTGKDNTQQDTPGAGAVGLLRTQLRTARKAMQESSRDRGGLLMRARLYAWLGTTRDAAQREGKTAPRVVAAYWPMTEEPDLCPLLEQWIENHIVIALPVVRQKAAPLEFRAWTPEAPMQEGAYGILEPVGDTVVKPDVILVPTLGYTDRCDRVGYGGGYYDRTLAALRAEGHPFVAIGVAWSCGKIEGGYIPAPHDQRLDAILTQDGWVPKAP
jgi:5,10-methenyltetrahydrofolate synthetase